MSSQPKHHKLNGPSPPVHLPYSTGGFFFPLTLSPHPLTILPMATILCEVCSVEESPASKIQICTECQLEFGPCCSSGELAVCSKCVKDLAVDNEGDDSDDDLDDDLDDLDDELDDLDDEEEELEDDEDEDSDCDEDEDDDLLDEEKEEDATVSLTAA